MGIFSNPWQGIDRFIRHPVDEITHPFGHHDKFQHFKNNLKDAGIIAAEAGAAVLTGGESVFAEEFARGTVKNWGGKLRRSLYGTVKKRVTNKGNSTWRSVSNAPFVLRHNFQHYSKKVQDNSAMSGGNRRMAQIPEGAKREYESRYFEVYRDSKGETYLWGKPTLGPNSFRKDPAGFAREWGENVLRLDPKYKKSDPLYRDMAKIRRKYGNIDHISGYSRGGAAAKYQSAKSSKSSRIYGPYVPYGGIGDHRARRRRKFDPIHVGARGITKYGSSARRLYRAGRGRL